jgi:hypothetical protein
MTAPSLTHKLQIVQKLLDYGVTVTIENREYVQAHRLFLRGTLEKGDGTIEARPLAQAGERLNLMNLVSKMSEEEFFTASSTSALNDGFKGRTSVLEMIHAAVNVFNEHKDKILYINEYILDDKVIKLPKPQSIVLKKANHELPIELSVPELFEFGQNISEIDTLYKFSQARQSDPEIPQGARIYGSMHKYNGEIIQPKFVERAKPENSLEFN